MRTQDAFFKCCGGWVWGVGVTLPWRLSRGEVWVSGEWGEGLLRRALRSVSVWVEFIGGEF